jgi:hypothetical protein
MLEVETQGQIPVEEPSRAPSSSRDPKFVPQRASSHSRRASRNTEPVKVTRRFDLDRGTYWECIEREHDGVVLRQVEHPLQEHLNTLSSGETEEEAPRQHAE